MRSEKTWDEELMPMRHFASAFILIQLTFKMQQQRPLAQVESFIRFIHRKTGFKISYKNKKCIINARWLNPIINFWVCIYYSILLVAVSLFKTLTRCVQSTHGSKTYVIVYCLLVKVAQKQVLYTNALIRTIKPLWHLRDGGDTVR